MLPCPFGPAFFGLAVGAGVVEATFGLAGGGASSSENESQPGSWMVTAEVSYQHWKIREVLATYQDSPGHP